jgi:hypothetical protein
MRNKKFKKIRTNTSFDEGYGWYEPKTLFGVIIAPFVGLIQSLIFIILFPIYIIFAITFYCEHEKVHWEEIPYKNPKVNKK